MNQMINLKHRPEPEPMESRESFREPEIPRSVPWTKLLVALLVILVLGKLAWLMHDGGKWRAVFLANNQVYFGKFVDWPFASSIRLSDIYYLQVSQGLQPQNGQAANPEVKVVKLGNEIHSPEDAMTIPKSQIVYWENLKTSGAVVQTIEKFKSSNP